MSEEKVVIEQGKFHRLYCPICNLQLNLQTKKIEDYKIKDADNKVWCSHCGRWIKFSLN